MAFRQDLLADDQAAFIHLSGQFIAALALIKARQAVQRRGDVRVVRADAALQTFQFGKVDLFRIRKARRIGIDRPRIALGRAQLDPQHRVTLQQGLAGGDLGR